MAAPRAKPVRTDGAIAIDGRGRIVLWGGSELRLPPGSSYSGGTGLSQGTLVIDDIRSGGQPSGLGAGPASATNVLFMPRYKHSVQNLRPRLRYEGPGAVTDLGIRLAEQADGILESSGSGALTWLGAVTIAATNTTTALFTLGGEFSGDNNFAGNIIDADTGVNLPLYKAGAGKWILSGSNVLNSSGRDHG